MSDLRIEDIKVSREEEKWFLDFYLVQEEESGDLYRGRAELEIRLKDKGKLSNFCSCEVLKF